MDLAFVESLEPAGAASAAGWRPGDAWLAGGTWLFSEPQDEVRRLLDLRAFAWRALTVRPTGLELAATCTLAELAAFAPPPEWTAAPVLRAACELLLGSFKVWNEATVGGNLCLALPAGPMTSLAASLDGVCEVWRASGRVELVPALRFVTGVRRTVLEPGDLLRSVQLPAGALRSQVAIRQGSRTRLGRSAAVLIGLRDPADGACRITVTAAVTHPHQLRFAAVPEAGELADALQEAELPYFDDAHGTVAWRAHLARRLAEQVRAELAPEAA